MATKDQRLGGDTPENPEDFPSEQSILPLDEHLAMQQSIGNRTRFEIVYRLVHGGGMSPSELNEAIPIDDSTLHSHPNKLVEVRPVERRKRTERPSEGLYTYYRATILAEAILKHGVEELLRREWDFKTAYSSDASEETE